MSTKATIWKQNPDGTYNGVYVHWDGYIKNGVGQMLHENWKSPCRVDLLIEQGDISSLGETLENTVFYSRDRGEPWSEVRPVMNGTMEEIVQDICYVYAGQSWWVNYDRTLVPVSDLL